MAELATLARPYARAAFETALAKGDGGLADFSYQLALLTGCLEVPELRAALIAPNRIASEKAGLIATLLEGELSPEADQFVRLLADRDRLVLLPEIQLQYEQQRAAHERVLKVEVISARDLDATQLAALEEKLAKRFACQVEMVARTDPSLIGGVVIRAGDSVIDGSVSGRVQRLRETLGVTVASHRATSRPTAA